MVPISRGKIRKTIRLCPDHGLCTVCRAGMAHSNWSGADNAVDEGSHDATLAWRAETLRSSITQNEPASSIGLIDLLAAIASENADDLARHLRALEGPCSSLCFAGLPNRKVPH